MYYPYVRGRQYELLALRELVVSGRLSEHITPIIEPVKVSSTLSKTMDEFVNNERKVCIICNPAVGSFNEDMNKDKNNINRKKFFDNLRKDEIIKSHIIRENSTATLLNWEEKLQIRKTDWYVINTNREYLVNYSEIFNEEPPKMSFIPDESIFKRKVRNNRALIVDRFNKCERNSDYAKNIDEFFSDDHLFYHEDGFEGFSDFSVIGGDYLESGFAPYAVAIHIVYFDEDKSLRVAHFVSESNSDIQNPAGKFYEAVKKLNQWVTENNIQPTPSLQVFLDHYNNETYPGLGSVKKLSLMHHLELIGQFLDGVE